MEAAGLFELPKTQRSDKVGQKPLVWSKATQPQAAIEGSLGQFGGIRLELALEKPAASVFNEYDDRYHYPGYRRPIGSYLRYFLIGHHGDAERLFGCLLLAFAVNRLQCRDEFIGGSDQQREKHLRLLANNTRFLIFPWLRVKNLASKSLPLAAKHVPGDRLKHHGFQRVLLETFVDPMPFSGNLLASRQLAIPRRKPGRPFRANPQSAVRLSALFRLQGGSDTEPKMAQSSA